MSAWKVGNQSKNIRSALEDYCQWCKILYARFVVNGQKHAQLQKWSLRQQSFHRGWMLFQKILNVYFLERDSHFFLCRSSKFKMSLLRHRVSQTEWSGHAVLPSFNMLCNLRFSAFAFLFTKSFVQVKQSLLSTSSCTVHTSVVRL